MIAFNFQVKDIEIVGGNGMNRERYERLKKLHPVRWIRIELEDTRRTLSQNALYWKYLAIIERETGNVADDMHEFFRRTLLEPKFIKVKLKVEDMIQEVEIKIPRSTTELTKEEFADYLDKIAAETNVPIPDTEAYNRYFNSAPMK